MVEKKPPTTSLFQPVWFNSQTTIKNSCQTKKLSPFFLFLFTFLFTLIFSLSWVSAQEQLKPKPQSWQIDGIVAALDDSSPQVKRLALAKLATYQPQDLKPPVVKKPEDIAQKAAKILKDDKVDVNVRSYAAAALDNLGTAGAKYAPDILNFLKDDKVGVF